MWSFTVNVVHDVVQLVPLLLIQPYLCCDARFVSCASVRGSEMPYISSDGRVGGQSGWSLAAIPALFWGFINFIVLFFQTLINPDATSRGSSQSSFYGSSGRRPPPGPPPRRMGRINHGSSPGPPPMMGGG